MGSKVQNDHHLLTNKKMHDVLRCWEWFHSEQAIETMTLGGRRQSILFHWKRNTEESAPQVHASSIAQNQYSTQNQYSLNLFEPHGGFDDENEMKRNVRQLR